MNSTRCTFQVFFPSLSLLVLSVAGTLHASETPVLRVVTTLPDYADLARRIGGSRVEARHIVMGDQDAHFIRPKPSFATMVAEAQVLVATGLDLELWLPAIVDRSGNPAVRSEESGYVAAAQGMRLLEKPDSLSREAGGLHIHGNPHVTSSPINMKVAARNIAAGLIKNDPAGKELYEANLRALLDEFDRRFFGEDLVRILGGETLCSLAEQEKLAPFLASKKYKGKPLSEYAGGWWKAMAPLRGTRIVSYHKSWIYLFGLFGLVEAGTIEPKPGIPPSPRHFAELLESMRKDGVKIIFAENYFSHSDVLSVAEKTGAQPVIVPVYVGGAPGTEDYFKLVDHWVSSLLAAAQKAGLIEKSEKK